MPSVHCDPCRRLRNVVDRNRRAGRPSNLKLRPCTDCKERNRQIGRQASGKPSQAVPADEQMLYLLTGGPELGATRKERQAAVRQLLIVKPRLTHPEIARRVGVSSRTVLRVSTKLRGTLGE